MLISLALIITLIVLVFARDVSRSAHGAITERRSENKSFAALANGLINQENSFDTRLDRLVVQGQTLPRVVFAARLYQLNDELPQWATDAGLLDEPTLAHHVNQTLSQLTIERVAAYETLLDNIAHDLTLPWSTPPLEHVANPAATLVSTSEKWNKSRFALVKEPGLVHLVATTEHSAKYFVQHGASELLDSPSLELVRAIGIVAVRVSPSPLPAPSGVLLLPPVRSVELGVSVLNASYDEQPVTLTIRVVPTSNLGKAYSTTLHATIGPLKAYAFVPKLLTTKANETAGIVISVSGARAAVGKVTTEHFRLEMSPSGNS